VDQHEAIAAPLTFTTSVDGISAAALDGGFFDGWAAPPSTIEHLALLQASSHVALAVHSGRVVGFANALSDGVLSAYIPLLEVLPPYRGQGTGTQLVRMLLDAVGHLYMVDVMCDDDVLPFYEAVGFQRGGGVVRRNYAWRSAP
jgi:GNAT superfamily N-acetyltransferase